LAQVCRFPNETSRQFLHWLPINLTWATGDRGVVNKPSAIGICFFSLAFGRDMNHPLLFEKSLRVFPHKKGISHPGGGGSLFLEDPPAKTENAYFPLKK